MYHFGADSSLTKIVPHIVAWCFSAKEMLPRLSVTNFKGFSCTERHYIPFSVIPGGRFIYENQDCKLIALPFHGTFTLKGHFPYSVV